MFAKFTMAGSDNLKGLVAGKGGRWRGTRTRTLQVGKPILIMYVSHRNFFYLSGSLVFIYIPMFQVKQLSKCYKI